VYCLFRLGLVVCVICCFSCLSWVVARGGVLEAMALDSRRLRTICHVLGLGLGLERRVLGLRGKALGLDPFSLVCLVFFALIGLVL